MSHTPGFDFFGRHKEKGAFFVRLVVGFVLVYGTQDKVFGHGRMLEFRDFLAARRVPLPLFSAYLSAYAQFVCGILYVVGLLVRPAALVMVINFVAALAIAHLDAPLDASPLALCMLFSSLFLLSNGAGALSLDNYFRKEAGGADGHRRTANKRRGPLRSPLRSGPLLVRSLTYVLTGATEPLDYLSEDSSISVGKPARALPFACGLPPNRPPLAGPPIPLKLTAP